MKIEYSPKALGARIRDGANVLAYVQETVFHGRLNTVRRAKEFAGELRNGVAVEHAGARHLPHDRPKHGSAAPDVDDWQDEGDA